MRRFARPIANTMLVQDVSSSMTDTVDDGTGNKRQKIEILKDANKALLAHKIKHCPKDLVGCVVFSDSAHVLFKLTQPTNSWVAQRIEKMRVGGMTNMVNGLQLGMRLLAHRSRRFLANIVLLSDGHHNVGSSERLLPLAQEARRQHINIHTIGFGDNPDNFDEGLLKSIAATTHNGRYCHAWQLSHLVKALVRFS